MRVSCNGCRILRKGCSENCTIRPCLEWIKSPESQANATVFLAKFYGRAGLLNLINAGPVHLRPAIFRSLLYEASGRIVNPMYGSVGLLWSGRWQVCQSAVEAILRGDPIKQIPAESDIKLTPSGLHKAFSYDIRHVSKDSDLKRVNKTTRARFKRPGKLATDSSIVPWRHAAEYWGKNTPSLESVTGSVAAEERRKAIMLSMETTEASTVGSQSEVDLELTLGYESVPHRHSPFRGSSSSSSS